MCHLIHSTYKHTRAHMKFCSIYLKFVQKIPSFNSNRFDSFLGLVNMDKIHQEKLLKYMIKLKVLELVLLHFLPLPTKYTVKFSFVIQCEILGLARISIYVILMRNSFSMPFSFQIATTK